MAWDPETGLNGDRIGVYEPASRQYRWTETRTPDRGGVYSGPQWWGDGRRVVLASEGDLFRIDLDDGSESLLLEAPPGVAYGDANVAPDGASLYYLRLEEEADLWLGRLSEEP